MLARGAPELRPSAPAEAFQAPAVTPAPRRAGTTTPWSRTRLPIAHPTRPQGFGGVVTPFHG